MLERLLQNDVIGPLDLAFARFLGTLADGEPEVVLAASLLSRSVGEGHICIDLREIAGADLPDGSGGSVCRCPDLERWEHCLRGSRLVGRPGEEKPLILDDRRRLYLHRYHRYESRLAERIVERVGRPDLEVERKRARTALSKLFPDASAPDYQLLAAVTALLKRFCVISGGPGTGKTTTAARILRLLREADPHRRLQVALAAPTGKAASRLSEAIDFEAAEPPEGRTVHRLLAELAAAREPAPDVVVVDEASMADLSLMSRLMNAVPPLCRMIWLGDKDQLSSVEAGAVLGDVCGESETTGCSAEHRAAVEELTGRVFQVDSPVRTSPLRDSIVLLERSYRFAPESGIGSAARSVRHGDSRTALDILCSSGDAVFRDADADRFGRDFVDRVRGAYTPFACSSSPEEAFSRLEAFRVLCALRRGLYGVEEVNRRIEDILAREGRIDPYHRWYSHRPIMVVQNDYGLRLFNGDVGVVLPSSEGSARPAAFFPDRRGGFREIPPVMLPEHETVFALTVHKSQGSEYDEVLFLLPPAPTAILSRELVYTAITRARRRVEIWGKREVFRRGVEQKIRRTSGLRDALWGEPEGGHASGGDRPR